MAFAKVVIPAGKGLLLEISEMCKKEGVGAIVMGDSRNYAQEENPIMKEVHVLKKEIRDTLGLPVYLEPELMSSLEAERVQGHSEMHDASAAAIILKSYIDRTQNSKNKNPMTAQEVKDLTHEIRKSEHENRSSEDGIQNEKTEIYSLRREKSNLKEEAENS